MKGIVITVSLLNLLWALFERDKTKRIVFAGIGSISGVWIILT